MTYEVPIVWKSPKWWRNRPMDERVFHFGIPRRIQMALEDYDLDDTGKDWAVNWSVGDSLLLTGPANTGKSVQAAYLAKSLLHRGLSAKWVDGDGYVQALKDSFDGAESDAYTPYYIKNVKNVFDVVVLDGLGDERLTDFARHELGTLIRNRYDRMLTTIVTSRVLEWGDMEARYGDRLTSVMSNGFEHEEMDEVRE